MMSASTVHMTHQPSLDHRGAAAEPVAAAAAAPRPGRLRRVLVAADAAATFVAWCVVLAGGPGAGSAATQPLLVVAGAAIAAAATVAAAHALHLHLSRACAVRSVEVAGLARASVAGAVAVAIAGGDLGLAPEVALPVAATGTAACFAGLTAGRGIYRSWLRGHRRVGDFTTPVLVVGDAEEGAGLCRLLADHPEAGFRVVGVLGRHGGAGSHPHLGPPQDVVRATAASGATGVIVAASELSSSEINQLVRDCHRGAIHVHLSTGLWGIDRRRIRHRPLAHEPLFYVEPLRLAPWQQSVKRVIDLVGAALVGLAALPVLAVAAVAIRCHDGGPVLFRQERIGRDGEPFTVLKLRTMVPGADQLLAQVATDNERDGPLFKQSADPRRTSVGRVLERLSIDELPQVWNVLRGDMSLVGPRPALPEEVAQFDDELRERLRLLPGITGLWQVEARDNPSFAAYRRYDLFYLENWSVALDLAILSATVQNVLARSVSAVRRSPARGEVLRSSTGITTM